MEKNVGTLDRIVRFVLGAVLLAVGFFFGWGWYIPAALLILTGVVRFCTPYWILGVSTCKVKQK